jgi:hypothetical protein
MSTGVIKNHIIHITTPHSFFPQELFHGGIFRKIYENKSRSRYMHEEKRKEGRGKNNGTTDRVCGISLGDTLSHKVNSYRRMHVGALRGKDKESKTRIDLKRQARKIIVIARELNNDDFLPKESSPPIHHLPACGLVEKGTKLRVPGAALRRLREQSNRRQQRYRNWPDSHGWLRL